MAKFVVGDKVIVSKYGRVIDEEVIGKVIKNRGGMVAPYVVVIQRSDHYFWKVGETCYFSGRDLDHYPEGVNVGKPSVYNKFSVGDWVRTTDGATGKVYDLDYKHVLFTDERGNSRRQLYYNLQKADGPGKREISVGDRVRCTDGQNKFRLDDHNGRGAGWSKGKEFVVGYVTTIS